MYCSDYTDADIATALWHLLEDMAGSSNTLVPQGVHEDPITGYTSAADTNFNAGNDTAFTTASIGTFTTQPYYSYPVSKQ